MPEIGACRGNDSDAGTTRGERLRKVKGFIEGRVDDEPIEIHQRHHAHSFSAVAGADHRETGAVDYPFDESAPRFTKY